MAGSDYSCSLAIRILIDLSGTNRPIFDKSKSELQILIEQKTLTKLLRYKKDFEGSHFARGSLLLSRVITMDEVEKTDEDPLNDVL